MTSGGRKVLWAIEKLAPGLLLEDHWCLYAVSAHAKIGTVQLAILLYYDTDYYVASQLSETNLVADSQATYC